MNVSSGGVNIDSEKAEAVGAGIEKVSQAHMSQIEPLAKWVEKSGENDIAVAIFDLCKKMQDVYNDKYAVASAAVLTESEKFPELNAAIKRGAASINELKAVNADIEVAKINVPSF
jgi:hypothetical protein